LFTSVGAVAVLFVAGLLNFKKGEAVVVVVLVLLLFLDLVVLFNFNTVLPEVPFPILGV